jgi:hypothetical protein
MRQITIGVKEAGDIAYYSPKIRERNKEKDNENLVGEKECFAKHTLGSHVMQTKQFHRGVRPLHKQLDRSSDVIAHCGTKISTVRHSPFPDLCQPFFPFTNWMRPITNIIVYSEL